MRENLLDLRVEIYINPSDLYILYSENKRYLEGITMEHREMCCNRKHRNIVVKLKAVTQSSKPLVWCNI